MNEPQLRPRSESVISIRQRLEPFAFRFRVVDVWNGFDGNRYVWLEDVSPAMLQMLALVSMWGGPVKHETINDKEREAWEIHEDQVPWLRFFIERTKHYRETDTASL